MFMTKKWKIVKNQFAKAKNDDIDALKVR